MNKKLLLLLFLLIGAALYFSIRSVFDDSEPLGEQKQNSTMASSKTDLSKTDRADSRNTSRVAEDKNPLDVGGTTKITPFNQANALIRNDPQDLFPEAETLATDGLSETEYISSLFSLMDKYAIIIKDGGYPTGLNVEITNALLGKNKQKVALLPQDHPRINDNGELVDHWGNPYHFHLQSLRQIGVRSAGEDGIIHTEDDIYSQNYSDEGE